MAQVKFEDLLGTGAHFGHVTRKWDPNFKPYILLEKNGVHLFLCPHHYELPYYTLGSSSNEKQVGKVVPYSLFNIS